MAIHHHKSQYRAVYMHGHKFLISTAPKREKLINVGITVHGKPGAHMHKFSLSNGAKQDAWHHKAQA